MSLSLNLLLSTVIRRGWLRIGYFSGRFYFHFDFSCRFDGLAAEGTEYSVSLSTELDGKTITQVTMVAIKGEKKEEEDKKDRENKQEKSTKEEKKKK